MKNYRGSLLYLILFVLALETLVVVVGDLSRPTWGDESHFVRTVLEFHDRLDLDRLASYNELSGPLPFAAYAAWGHLVGVELWRLRLLSLLIALTTYLLFHRLLWEHFHNGVAALLTTVFLAVHPYMVGFSIFVFTDGLTIMFLVAGLLAYRRRIPWLLAIGVAGALLCRQYAVFLPIAAIMCLAHEFIRDRKPDSGRLLVAVLSGVLPFVALLLLWGGLSPVNRWREFYATEHLTFHPSYLVLYIALLALYAAPLLFVVWRPLYRDRRVLIGAFVLSWSYWLFPVKASAYAVDVNVHTVGLLHKALIRVIAAPWFAQTVFFVGFALGLPILYAVIRSAFRAARLNSVAPTLLYDLAILGFLALMPFSYLNWEKYFVPLLPFLFVRLLMMRRLPHPDTAA